MSTDVKPQPVGQTLEQTWLKTPITHYQTPSQHHTHSRLKLSRQPSAPTAMPSSPTAALIFNNYVCPSCDEHLAMNARTRLQWF